MEPWGCLGADSAHVRLNIPHKLCRERGNVFTGFEQQRRIIEGVAMHLQDHVGNLAALPHNHAGPWMATLIPIQHRASWLSERTAHLHGQFLQEAFRRVGLLGRFCARSAGPRV